MTSQGIHEFILDNLEFFFAIIVIAQGIILFGQSQIKRWADGIFSEILNYMKATNVLNKNFTKHIEELEKKVK